MDYKTFMIRIFNNIFENDHEDYNISIENYSSLYRNIDKEEIRNLLSYFHYKFNHLFSFMNSKFDSNRHYNADPSRELLHVIKMHRDLTSLLKSTNYNYFLVKDYSDKIKESLLFLKDTGGSQIPETYEKLDIIEYEPIFILSDTIKIKSNVISNENLTHIGSGSYANVYKFKHPDFNKNFALKRANKNSTPKEIIRFKKEFKTMKAINSPYVVEVFDYNEDDNSYTMEYIDYTLDKFYKKYNDKLEDNDRLNLINQVFKIFNFLHDREILHRDLSYSNILIKEYDDVNIVKISDFGRVKTVDSNLTSVNTAITGSLNDNKLSIIGFDKYSLIHETYALTSIIYFLMFGKKQFKNYEKTFMKNFVNKGISNYDNERFQDVGEMKNYFYKSYKDYKKK